MTTLTTGHFLPAKLMTNKHAGLNADDRKALTELEYALERNIHRGRRDLVHPFSEAAADLCRRRGSA